MSDKIRVIKQGEKVWKPSKRTVGWEYVPFSHTDGGPFTVQARCPAGVAYHPWVSNKLVEHYVLEGTLTINGIDLEKGDYIGVEAGEEGFISSKTGMETLAIIHGEVVFADEVYDSLADGTMTVERADHLAALPWMDHLRRNANRHIETICNYMGTSKDETMLRFCINISRDISSPELIRVVKNIINSGPGYHLRLSATLFLGALNELNNDDWKIQLTELVKSPNELLDITRKVYNSKDDLALLPIIDSRKVKYPGNVKLYNLLIHLVKGGVGLPEGSI